MDCESEIPEAFWVLVDCYRDELRNQAHSILGRVEDAEDVVQETFCEAFRKNRQLSSAESLGAWLRVANRRNALDRLRQRRRTDSQRQRASSTAALTTGGFSGIELRETLGRTLGTLPANLRQVVTLRFYEHLSCKQIAQRLSLPEGTVKRLLFEASLRLYAKLKTQFDHIAPDDPLPGRHDKPGADASSAND